MLTVLVHNVTDYIRFGLCRGVSNYHVLPDTDSELIWPSCCSHRAGWDFRRSISSACQVSVTTLDPSLVTQRADLWHRTAAQLELDFNSVERVVEYMNVPQEAPGIIEDNRPPAYWPSSSGGLHVQDLQVQYAPDLPMVLKHISFDVQPSEKIGIVCTLFFYVHIPTRQIGGQNRFRKVHTGS
jgi:hypothetical protein